MSHAQIPTSDDFRFFYPKRVRYHEIDAQAVVYNAHYLTYFDIGLTEFARNCGWQEEPHKEFEFHVVKGEVNFRKPMRLDEKVEIGVRLGRVGRSSLSFDLAIFGPENSIRADGQIIWVWTDQKTGQSAPIPQSVIDLFSKDPNS